MLSKRTVFVVGAGASVPYGFPTGRDLVTEVLSCLSGSNNHRAFLEQECEFTRHDLNRFRDELLRSGKNSVDAFLEHRPDHLNVGKAAIAYVLIQKELEERLFALGQTNWLRYLYGRMNCSFNEFGENLVSFITFNYDRTIEHFLHTALCNTYKKHPELCAEQMSRIPIVHLHGRLGRLPWQGGSARPYEAAELNPTILHCFERIKIFTGPEQRLSRGETAIR